VVLGLLSKKDFHLVTLREICRLSGISPSTIYQYYSSKENLIFRFQDIEQGGRHERNPGSYLAIR
jgi:AcrR family transcriptional regulator